MKSKHPRLARPRPVKIVPPWSLFLSRLGSGLCNASSGSYNRFGFKAEEFIVGFYEDYLDPNSTQSKNAFRLRLRRW